MLSESSKLDEINLEDEEFDLSNLPPPGFSGEEENPGPFMSFVFHTVTYLFPFLFVATVYFSLNNLMGMRLTWTIVPALVASWFLADFITGLVHWACDTYGTVNTPIVGHSFIRNFRSHHRYPKDITISPLVYTVGPVALLSLLTLPVAIVLSLYYPQSFLIAFVSFIYAFITFLTVLTNQFHKWAHADSTDKWVVFLQKHKLILNPDHHKLHHTAPFESNYCITHGGSNPFLEKIRFFRTVEFLLAKIGFKTSVY